MQTKADLIGLLKEYAAKGGDKIRLNLVETELYSPSARDAEKRFGIEPHRVLTTDVRGGPPAAIRRAITRWVGRHDDGTRLVLRSAPPRITRAVRDRRARVAQARPRVAARHG